MEITLGDASDRSSKFWQGSNPVKLSLLAHGTPQWKGQYVVEIQCSIERDTKKMDRARLQTESTSRQGPYVHPRRSEDFKEQTWSIFTEVNTSTRPSQFIEVSLTDDKERDH